MGTAPRAIYRIGHALPQALPGYGLAVLSVLTMLLIKLLINPLLERPSPFLLFFAAVMASAWYGGFGPGLLAISLSALLSDYFFLTPDGSLASLSLDEWLRMGIFVAEGLAICVFSARRSRAERVLHARVRQQSEDRLARVLQTSADGVLIFDADGRLAYANTAAEQLLGSPAVRLYGRRSSELSMISAAEGQPPAGGLQLRQVLLGGEPVHGAQYTVEHSDGRRTILSVNVAPLRDPDGAQSGAVASLRDVSEAARAAAERERLLAEVQTERGRLEAVLRQMPAGVIIADAPSGQLVLSNQQFQRITRRPPGELSTTDDYLSYPAFRADGQPYRPDEWPLVRAIRDGEEISDEEMRIVCGDGSESNILISAGPIRDREGRIIAAVATLYDITQRTHEAVAQRFLADAGAQLALSLDFDTTLQALVRLTVPTLADFCTIHSVDGDELRLLLAAHRDPEGEALLHEINRRYPMRVSDHLSMPDVIAEGRPLMVSAGGEPSWRLQPHDEQHQALLRELRIGSFIMLPLTVRGVTFGALTLLRSLGSRAYTQSDFDLAQELARRAAVALDNARLYRETQEAVRARDQFLSIASHELKTPLTSLMGYAELLQRRTAREGTLKERDARSLAVVVEQSVRLNKLIGALLDLSRIQSGQLSIERQPLDLAALVARLVESMQPALEQHVFQLDGADEPVLVEGDELRLEQVVQNLLQNAVKYSPQGGQVGVLLERRDSAARLSVTDQGIGIPKEALPRLFQRFYRATNVDPQHISGMGIGLFVVREIVSLHGGTVSVHSQEDQGSTFVVELPVLRA